MYCYVSRRRIGRSSCLDNDYHQVWSLVIRPADSTGSNLQTPRGIGRIAANSLDLILQGHIFSGAHKCSSPVYILLQSASASFITHYAAYHQLDYQPHLTAGNDYGEYVLNAYESAGQ